MKRFALVATLLCGMVGGSASSASAGFYGRPVARTAARAVLPPYPMGRMAVRTAFPPYPVARTAVRTVLPPYSIARTAVRTVLPIARSIVYGAIY